MLASCECGTGNVTYRSKGHIEAVYQDAPEKNLRNHYLQQSETISGASLVFQPSEECWFALWRQQQRVRWILVLHYFDNYSHKLIHIHSGCFTYLRAVCPHAGIFSHYLIRYSLSNRVGGVSAKLKLNAIIAPGLAPSIYQHDGWKPFRIVHWTYSDTIEQSFIILQCLSWRLFTVVSGLREPKW